MSDKYNGWTNYETWLANLWHDDAFTDIAEEMYDNAIADSILTKEQNAKSQLADYIKEYIEEQIPEGLNGLFADLLNASIQEIDFYDIAENYIDEIVSNND